MNMPLTIITSAIMALSMLACASGSENQSTEQKTKKKVEALPDGVYARIKTSKGTILIRFEHEKAPMTVANFVALAEGKMKNTAKAEGTPYFDGLIFHRVIPGFMIQGGDPTGTGMGNPGYAFADEIHPELKHTRAGTLSMANAGPATNGSQFFITNGPTPHLDSRHAVFGYVVQGQDVVDAIAGVPRGQGDKPTTDVVMEKVTIERVGKAAKAWDAMAVLNANKDKFRGR